jgi:hypothetical protein
MGSVRATINRPSTTDFSWQPSEAGGGGGGAKEPRVGAVVKGCEKINKLKRAI